MVIKLIIQQLKKFKRIKEVKDWEKQGKTPPTPQLIKQEVVREYAEHYNIDTLIETGTYMGDMIEAVKDNFEEIYSIELSEAFYNKCEKRFPTNFPAVGNKINLFCGDSAKVLPEILTNLANSENLANSVESNRENRENSEKSENLANSLVHSSSKIAKLFWLDAHYSGGETAHADLQTPIVQELKVILNDNPEHIILIDDARLFNGTNDYPIIKAVETFAAKFGKKISVVDDIIRIT